jgi:hypothetical protein
LVSASVTEPANFPVWQNVVHVAQLTFVDKSTETKWLILLSLKYARQKAIRRKTLHLFSIK